MKQFIFILICLLCFSSQIMAMEENFDGNYKLSAYKTFIITDFSTKDTIYKLFDEDELNKIKQITSDMVKKITLDLENKLKNTAKFSSVLINDGSSNSKAVKLEGKIDEINGGHGAAKFALSFMAPKSVKAYLSYSGKLIDVDSGKVIGTFSDTNTGSFWMRSSLSYSKGMLDDISEEVFDFIEDNL